MRFIKRTAILPSALGATLMSTVALRGLAAAAPDQPLSCVTRFPALLANLPYVAAVYAEPLGMGGFEHVIQDCEVTDLTGTLDDQPNRRAVARHLIDLLCERADVPNDGGGPECVLTADELSAAHSRLERYRTNRARRVVVFSTRTATPNKEWPLARWQELVVRARDIRWVHVGSAIAGPILPGVVYETISPRETIALCGAADGVVTLDTFLLHAAKAARQRNTVALFGSTRPECVSYPEFKNLYLEGYECQPCGRPFHRMDLAYTEAGEVGLWPNGKARKWECAHVDCMKLLTSTLY
jgi:ADP-heptose:LPS heptosyltransferase